jgi:hypothetical protein
LSPSLSTPTPAAPSPSATVAAKPKPSATTAEKPAEKSPLKLAQKFEQQEQYDEAIKAYEEYLSRSPNMPDAAAITSYLNELRKVQGALVIADSAMDKEYYQVAVRQYSRALQIRPTSARAKKGVEDASEKLRAKTPPGAKRGFPFDQSEFPPGRGRQGQPGQMGQPRRRTPEQLNPSQPPNDRSIPPPSQRRPTPRPIEQLP